MRRASGRRGGRRGPTSGRAPHGARSGPVRSQRHASFPRVRPCECGFRCATAVGRRRSGRPRAAPRRRCGALPHAQGGRHIRVRGGQRLAHRPHAMVEPNIGVPQRIPQFVRDRPRRIGDLPSYNSTRSRSEYGNDSRRPSPPTPTMAGHCLGDADLGRFRVQPVSYRSSTACRVSASFHAVSPSDGGSRRAAARSTAAHGVSCLRYFRFRGLRRVRPVRRHTRAGPSEAPRQSALFARRLSQASIPRHRCAPAR